jgi:hypothetical protein
MQSPGPRNAHRQAEDFAIVMKTLRVRETLRVVHACTRPTEGRSTIRLMARAREISEIHWICDESVHGPEIQSVWPVHYTDTQLFGWYPTERSDFEDYSPLRWRACGVVDESSDRII